MIPATKACGLCGEPPGHLYGTFFGGRADGVDLHHDFDRIAVGKRDDGTPIKVTCFEAWTVYGLRKIATGVYGSYTIKVAAEDIPGMVDLLRSLRADDELDCGA